MVSFGGAWHGQYTMTQCSGRRHCNESRGRDNPFSLLLEQTNAFVSGVFHAEGFAISVQGQVSDSGELVLTGRRQSPGGFSPTVELTRFNASATPAGLVASLEFQVRFPPDTPPSVNAQLQTIGGTVAGAQRGTHTPVNSFDGTWAGSLFINDCSAEGRTSCWPEERAQEYSFEVTLHQSGDRVMGELNFRGRLPVRGTVTGDTVTFDPAVREEPQSSGRFYLRLQRLSLTRDAVGSVRGEIYFSRDTVWDASTGTAPSSTRYYGTIVYGVPVP